MTQEESVFSKITRLFAAEEILLQCSVLSDKVDAYFLKHKLAIEIDEQGHNGRPINYEVKRQEKNKKRLHIY